MSSEKEIPMGADYDDSQTDSEELERNENGVYYVMPAILNKRENSEWVEVSNGVCYEYRGMSIMWEADAKHWLVSHPDTPDITESATSTIHEAIQEIETMEEIDVPRPDDRALRG